jgi:uncharacterized membrane protein YfhO
MSEYGYLCLGALIPAVIFFLIYLSRGLYPFGNGTVLVLDLNGQYFGFFEALRDTVLEGGSLLYSWSRSLGGEFLGIYAYYIASPLSYLICLFPDTKIQEFLLIMFMIKAATCGFTMGFYLHKHSETKNKLTVVAFSVLYAMSAYCVVQQNNTMWIDAVMWLPLVAYGVEQIVKYGKYKVFVIFLALTLASNFYIGYMCCIFVLLYYFFYMLAYKENNVNNPCNEKAHWGKSLIRMGVFSAIAIGIAAVIVLGAYYALQFGKNEFTDPSWEITLRFDFFDFLFKLLPSSYDTVRIDGLPFVYCGLLTVILAPLFFCSKKFTTREKIASGAFLMIFVLSFMISVVDLVWHGFQKPQWLNNRYSFMFCFFLIFLAFRAFEAIEEFSAKHIAAVSAFIFFFVVILQNFSEEYKDKLVGLTYGPKAEDFDVHQFATVLLTVIALIVYTSIIAVMKRAKNTDLVAAVLLCVICVEVFLSGLCNINDLDEDVGYTSYSKYNEYHTLMRPVTETLLEDYDTSFYRAEKTYHRKTNDNMALKLRGLSNSTSTLNKDTIKFLDSMGYFSSSHHSQYLGGNPVSDALLGIKYVISNRDLSGIYGGSVLDAEDYAAHEGMTVDELREATFADEYNDMSAEDFNVYLNKWALSLAFAADDAIFDINFKDQNSWVKADDERYNPSGYTSPFTRLNALITAILGEEETIEVFKPALQNGEPEVKGATATVSSDHNKYVNEDGYKYQSSSKKGSGTVTYTYTVPEGVQLYLFFPAYYSREIKISSETMPIFEASNGTVTLSKCDERIVELGYTQSSEYKLTVTIINDANQFYTKLDPSFIYYVDVEAMNYAFSRIQANQLVINEDYKEDDIRGTITTNKNNQTVMTTIPYDEGWQIYVDGKKVEIKETLDALITFEIENTGEHNVRMVYRSTAFTLGIAITIASLSGFILIIIFEDKLKRLAIIRYFCVEDPEENLKISDSNKK